MAAAEPSFTGQLTDAPKPTVESLKAEAFDTVVAINTEQLRHQQAMQVLDARLKELQARIAEVGKG